MGVSSQQLNAEAIAAIRAEDFYTAIEKADRSSLLMPHLAEPHILKGIALSGLGRNNEATDAFARAVRLEPNSSRAYYNLATHLYQTGDRENALRFAQRALQLQPDYESAANLVDLIQIELDPARTVAPSAVDIPDMETLAPPAGKLQDAAGEPEMVVQVEESEPATAEPLGSVEESPAKEPEQAAPVGFPPLSTPPQIPTVQRGMPYGNVDDGAGYASYKKPWEEDQERIPFITNLGSMWVTIGIAVATLSAIIFVFTMVQTVNMVTTGLADGKAISPAEVQVMLAKNYPGLAFGTLVANSATILWLMLDLAHRRRGWAWALPCMLCACCTLGWISLPLYIGLGRKKDY